MANALKMPTRYAGSLDRKNGKLNGNRLSWSVGVGIVVPVPVPTPLTGEAVLADETLSKAAGPRAAVKMSVTGNVASSGRGAPWRSPEQSL
jgi:hypothetical protein